jgi:hypothetical protein
MWEQKPAQIEEINQCIYNHRHYNGWYYFDTVHIVKQAPQFGHYDEEHPENSYLFQGNTTNNNTAKKLLDIRYDFLYMDIYQEGDSVIYDIEVRNSLWDGKLIVYKSQTTTSLSNSPSIKRYSDDDKRVTITCKGKDRFAIRVAFHLSQVDTDNSSQIEIINQSEFTEQYDEAEPHMGLLINTATLKGINGGTISLVPCNELGEEVNTGIPKSTTTTQGNQKYVGPPLEGPAPNDYDHTVLIESGQKGSGLFTITYGKVTKPGTYYALLKARCILNNKEHTTAQLIRINKIQEKKRSIDWMDQKQFETVFKGSKAEFTIEVNGINQYDQLDPNLVESLRDLPVTINVMKEDNTSSQYSSKISIETITDSNKKKVSKAYVHFTVDYREYYHDKSVIEVILHATDCYPRESAKHIVNHVWYKAHSFEDIRSECARENGADYILVEPGVHEKTGAAPITITRNQTIAGIQSKIQWATLDGKSGQIITVAKGKGSDNFTIAHLIGLKFIDGFNAIYTKKYTNVVVDRCYFTNNKFPSLHYSGTCITNESSEEARQNRKMYITTVKNSYFYNNQGNCIRSLGTTLIYNNLFKTDAWDKLKQPQPKVVYVESGDTHYIRNKSYINVGNKPKTANHSFAKALTYVEKNGTFNRRGPSELHSDDSLPLYGERYNNQAYTYAIYYNPELNIDTEVVCSPKEGREYTSTGHGAYPKRWIYSDGYQFNEYDDGRNKGNTNDWVPELLVIPVNLGIYDEETNTFIEGYNPIPELPQANEELYPLR